VLGCATPVHPPERVTAALTQAVEAGRVHHEAGRPVEATQLAEQVLDVDPDFPGVRELRISRGLALSREERTLLRTLAEMQASEATMQKYRASRGAGGGAGWSPAPQPW